MDRICCLQYNFSAVGEMADRVFGTCGIVSNRSGRLVGN